MKTVIFKSANDASKVASQLYNCELDGNTIKYLSMDEPALTLAVTLAGVDLPIVEGARCRLPFPRSERECNDEDTPKIYVACLSAYNNSYLHGLYIDATQEPEDIRSDITWMLSWSPMADIEACVHEVSRRDEWAIHDYECWEDIELSENEDIEKVSELAKLLKEHGQAYAAYYNYYGDYATEEDFQDCYYGQYENEEDFVYQMWEDCGMLQKLAEIGINELYIDWKAMTRDWFIDSYFSVEVGYKEIYVFSRH